MTEFSYGKLRFTSLTDTTCKVGWNESVNGNGAVEGTNIKGKITIPSVVKDKANCRTYIVTETGRYSFRNCIGITNIILPDTLIAIRFDSFYATQITRILIPKSVQTFGDSCFSSTSKLKDLIFESGSQLTTIERCSFYCNYALEYITLPPSVTTFGVDVFYACRNLKEVHICSCIDASLVSYPFTKMNSEPKVIVNLCYKSPYFSNITVSTEGSSCSFSSFPVRKLCYYITQKQNNVNLGLIRLLTFILIE